MNRLVDTDENVIDLFLNKEAPQKKNREKAKLSDYKFQIRPVNGKSVETLE